MRLSLSLFDTPVVQFMILHINGRFDSVENSIF